MAARKPLVIVAGSVQELPTGDTVVGGGDVTLTGAQTLTNKTLTTPVINGFSGTGNGTVTGNLTVSGNTTLGDSAADTVTIPGALSVGSLNGGPLAGFRNRIINGGFAVDQRNQGASLTMDAGTKYSCDRWLGYTASTNIAQRVAGDANSRYAVRLTKPSGSATNNCLLTTALETSDSIPLAGKTICISFRARVGSTYTGAATPIVVVNAGTGTDQSTFLCLTAAWTGIVTLTKTAISNPNLTTTFQTYSFTATVGASATQIGLVIGMTMNAVAGSANDYIDITDVQLTPGSVATPFEARPIGVEELLCKRYFERIGGSASNRRNLGTCSASSTTTASLPYVFSVPKRVTPTSVVFNGAADWRALGMANGHLCTLSLGEATDLAASFTVTSPTSAFVANGSSLVQSADAVHPSIDIISEL